MTIKKILLNFKEEMRVFQNILMKKQKKIEDNFGPSIIRMDGEVQKSLSYQISEYLRLYQQIHQLNNDNIVIKNQLLDIEKRIEDINLQIGSDFTNIIN